MLTEWKRRIEKRLRRPVGNATTPETPSSGTFAADGPISSREQDTLGRSPFARRLAEAIAGRNDPSSLVVGLYGPWGDGKTSLLNLMAQALEASGHIALVRFNPWIFGNEEQLLRAFFATLAASLKASLRTGGDVAGKTLEEYGGLLATGLSMVLGPLAPSGDTLEAAGRRLATPSLEDLKKRLEGVLRENGKTVVVLIDDIDRLDKNDTHTIFRLVKISAAFLRTVYVLAFDDKVVAEALADRYGAGGVAAGRRFLEKIVQIPLHLPAADRLVLRKTLFDQINRIIDSNGVRVPEGAAATFVRHYTDGLEPAVRTPRQVKRYANALEFALPLLNGEVHTSDFMLVEGLRVMYPTLYDSIREYPESYLLPREALGGDRQREEAKRVIDAGLATLPEYQRAPALGLLQELFPRTRGIHLNINVGDDWEESWAREQRIAAGEYFHRYFQYTVPQRDVPDAWIPAIERHAAAGEAAGIARCLQDAGTRDGLPRLIDKLRAREKTMDPNTAMVLAKTLALHGRLYPSKRSILSDVTSTAGQTSILIYNLIKRIPGEPARTDTALEVVRTAKPLPFAAKCASWLIHHNDKDHAAHLLQEAVEGDIRRVIAARVRNAAGQEPPYVTYPDAAAPLLWYWHLEAPGDLSDYLKRRFEADPTEATAFLRIYLPGAWNAETGLPVPANLERNAYDAASRLVSPDAILDALERVYGPDIRNGEYVYGLPDRMRPDELLARQFAAVHRAALAQGKVAAPKTP